MTVDQPGDQARRDSSDAVYRQGCRFACCDATTGPSTGDQPGDQACRDSEDAVHRQGYRCAFCDTATGPSTVARPGDQECRDSAVTPRQGCRDASGDAATGPADSDCGEDGGSPARAVHRQSCGRACDQADQPGDQARRNPTDSAHREGAPVPVGQPGDQACRDSAARGDATTGPSGSDSGANGRGHRKRPTKAEYAAMRKVEVMAIVADDARARLTSAQRVEAADPQRRAVRRLAWARARSCSRAAVSLARFARVRLCVEGEQVGRLHPQALRVVS